MTQVAGQLNINDLLSKDTKLDWTDESHVGKMIPFQKLQEYIGRKVIIEMPMQTRTWYKVVEVKSYYKDNDHSYKFNKKTGEYDIEHTYDRVGYSDDNRKEHKENSWVAEIYCKNGRFKPVHNYPECFYEYIA